MRPAAKIALKLTVELIGTPTTHRHVAARRGERAGDGRRGRQYRTKMHPYSAPEGEGIYGQNRSTQATNDPSESPFILPKMSGFLLGEQREQFSGPWHAPAPALYVRQWGVHLTAIRTRKHVEEANGRMTFQVLRYAKSCTLCNPPERKKGPRGLPTHYPWERFGFI